MLNERQINLFDKPKEGNWNAGFELEEPEKVISFDEAKAELNKKRVEQERRINHVLGLNIQESIVLREMINKGSTTVHDLAPKMNCPYGSIRDLQKTFGIEIDFTKEKRMKNVYRKGEVKPVTTTYKRYFLAKMEG